MTTREHGGATYVQSVWVRLTNAEIKALPVTPIVILEDPGAGLLIVPLAVISRSSIVGAYTNVSEGAALSVFRGETEQLGIGIAAIHAADALAVDASPDGGALTLRADNSEAGAFTGGNAANTMTLTVWYSALSV